MEWQNTPSPEIIKESAGFIYLITNKTNNRKYIGYKLYWKTIKKPALKGRSKADKKRIERQAKHRTKTKPNKRRVKIQSDWLDYNSSCEELKKDIKLLGEHNFKKKILMSCRTKMECQYEEARLQFEHGVLLSDKWYNDSIRCRFGGYVLRRCMK